MKNGIEFIGKRNRTRFLVFAITVILMMGAIIYSTFHFDTSKKLMGVDVISQGDIDAMTLISHINKEIYHYPIKFEGRLLPYDWQEETLYIPQNIEKKNFFGDLTADYGQLYFSDTVLVDGNIKKLSEYDKKSELIEKNAILSLYLIIDGFNYVKYNVVITGMPTITLNYDSYDEDTVSWFGEMNLIDPYHNENMFIESGCKFRKRGDSTSTYDKSSYNLTLNNKESLVGLRTDDDWALIALLEDNGYVHNKLSYDLWNDITRDNGVGWDKTVNSEFGEVFYDNMYVGMYLLTEKVDRKLGDLNKKDILYRLEETVYDSADPNMSITHVYSIKHPNDYTESDFEQINEFERTFFSTGEFDYKRAKSLLNMNNAIDMNLYSMLISATDNMGKNAFFVSVAKDDYKISEVMWDMNETFGDNMEFYEETITDPDMMVPHMSRLYKANPSEMSKLLYLRWCELRGSCVKPKKIKRKVENMVSYMTASGALRREKERWQDINNPSWKMDNIYKYIDGRIDYLDAHLKEEYEKYN